MQATGAAVSIYFQILFERLKVGSCASEVRAQLTVGLAPQRYSNKDHRSEDMCEVRIDIERHSVQNMYLLQ